ncbi:MAG: YebC/PmpR family DNA-binding transcriptional regulator, partial [Candidatus Cloacimonetes bacterium]|nr:YebC/PmpR family DNA-binding transcriptional regulator [Candidatus Cloacimonadota bacterium]
NPDFNPKLRLAIDKARQVNMPKENIERAINRGAGSGEGEELEEFTLEGYGPAGVAIRLFAISDNKNRTISEIRNLFQRSGGSLGEQGSAAFVFDEKGEPTFTVPIADKAAAQKVLTLLNALDGHDDVIKIWANFDIPEEFLQLNAVPG